MQNVMFTKSIKKGGTCELVRAVRSVMGWQYLHLREAPMVNVIPARKSWKGVCKNLQHVLEWVLVTFDVR